MAQERAMHQGILYYVRNPVGRGGLQWCVKVVGYNSAADAGPYVVPRNHVIECLPGSEQAVEKWKRNRCLELYDAAKHKDAILVAPEPVVLLETPMVEEEPAAKEKDKFSQSAPIAEDDEEKAEAPKKRRSDQAAPIRSRHGAV